MSSELKQKAGLVYNVVEGIVVLMTVGMLAKALGTLNEHDKLLSSHATTISFNTGRLDKLETSGSRGLGEHEKEDDTRISELKRRMDAVEAAVVVLQATPGELKSISVRLDTIREGQARIEKAIDDHLKQIKP